jgi:hypothetical protein
MTDTTSNLSAATKAARRIAAMHAARTPVDSQGEPTGPLATYTYDADGNFLSASKAESPKPAA